MTTFEALDEAFERATTAEDYALVRAEARAWPDSGSLHAALVAADCGYFIVAADPTTADTPEALELDVMIRRGRPPARGHTAASRPVAG